MSKYHQTDYKYSICTHMSIIELHIYIYIHKYFRPRGLNDIHVSFSHKWLPSLCNRPIPFFIRTILINFVHLYMSTFFGNVVWFHVVSECHPQDLTETRGFWEGASKVHEIRGELYSCASTLMAFCNEEKVHPCVMMPGAHGFCVLNFLQIQDSLT